MTCGNLRKEKPRKVPIGHFSFPVRLFCQTCTSMMSDVKIAFHSHANKTKVTSTDFESWKWIIAREFAPG